MKRKRFVKLMMSHGLERNKANSVAKLVKQYGSYEAVYNIPFLVGAVCAEKAWKQFKSTVNTLLEVIT